jgi:RHS repeat-associated protein
MWDFENRIVQAVVPDADTVTLKYDPFGRRIQKSGPATTTNYLYDGNNPLEEVDNSGNLLSRYNQTTRIDEELSEVRAGTTSYYQADGPGSVTSLSNASGVLANTYTYNSFGNLNASSGTLTNPFRFTGREFDSETGLYFYRARYVDSSTGRFISEDPLGFKGGVNFYVFVLNNPVNLRDPLGLKACENCTNAAPLPANSPKCDSYGSETYFGTSLKCFCKCAGDSAWSEQVRGCLAREHDRGTNPFVAHQRCYRAAGLTSAPWGVISKCYQECLAQPSGPGFPNMTPF